MLTNRIIPSLLLKNGRLVKGVRFADHRDAGAPATTCRAHSAQGADELLLLDIEASQKGQPPDFETLKMVAAEIQVPLTFGGSLNDIDHIRRAIASGADKVCLTMAALENPKLIEQGAHLLGAQAIMVGIDVTYENDKPLLYDHRRSRRVERPTFDDWARCAADSGAGEIRLCSVDREGSRQGLDLALYDRLRALVKLPIILEGGAGTLEHVAEAMRHGADSISLGTSLVFSDNNLVKVRRFLGGAGLKMRP